MGVVKRRPIPRFYAGSLGESWAARRRGKWTMEYAAEVACPCAHRLLCEVEGDGHSLRFLCFTDE
jgi:hypothetical protein